MATDIFIAPASGVINFNNGIYSASPTNIASMQVFDNVSTGRLQIAHAGASGINILNRNVSDSVFEVFGGNGTLFSVSDDLSDSVMSVNNAAGLPVFEVFADNTVVAGQYGQQDLVVSGNKIGINTVPTAGYTLQVEGNAYFGNFIFSTTIQPVADSLYDIGSTTSKYLKLYVDQIFDDGNSAGSSGQVLSSTGSGLDWVAPNTGPQGAQGIQGIQGIQGTYGAQGVQGVQGPLGPQGVQGIQGIQGVAGGTGGTGPTGPQGATGPTGPQGVQGIQGPLGPQGVQGIQGPLGPQGVQGIQGIQGTYGAQGVQGIQGIQGTYGAQGVQGTVGGERAAYTSQSGGAASTANWYPLFTISDYNHVPVICNLITYAHSSISFLVSEGYDPSGYHSINVLSHTNNDNGGYACVRGVRILNTGAVEVQLYWTSGPTVKVDVAIYGSYDTPSLAGSLVRNTAAVTVRDLYEDATAEGGKSRWHGSMALGQLANNTSATEYLVVGRSLTAGGSVIEYRAGGTQGDTGPQGVQGIQGPLGPQGVQGIQGIQGTYGTQGPTGPTGPQGATGGTGPQGVQGQTGSGTTGPQGAQGVQGVRGAQGAQGPTGSGGGGGSDYRIKENVKVFSDGYGLVKEVQAYSFNFKENNSFGYSPDEENFGFIAHEIQEAAGKLRGSQKFKPVEGVKDEMDGAQGKPIYQVVDYAKMTAVLWGALRSAIERIERIEKKVKILEDGS